MRTQIIQDHNGLPTGVFIPIEEWENMKRKYPDIEKNNDDLPQWQKDVLDKRLDSYQNNPDDVLPIETLFEILDQDV
ncbi:addiction module protein [Chryseobacterium sp.]|uniref:addiction module protein n=1 Tax=Chryseobacterium sp. TaxID=1871047 RepID=UPI00388FCB17